MPVHGPYPRAKSPTTRIRKPRRAGNSAKNSASISHKRCNRSANTQKAGKRVIAFALQGDFDSEQLRSNTFELEWPPRSGKRATFPEVDRVEWMDLARAREKILMAQSALLERLEQSLAKP